MVPKLVVAEAQPARGFGLIEAAGVQCLAEQAGFVGAGGVGEAAVREGLGGGWGRCQRGGTVIGVEGLLALAKGSRMMSERRFSGSGMR